jgi:uncharacterized protein YigE (DUF2233 family)
VLPVQELPQVDAGGAQAKTMTGVGVIEHGPIVELLPEHDARVGYGFSAIFHAITSSSLIAIASREQHLIGAYKGMLQF